MHVTSPLKHLKSNIHDLSQSIILVSLFYKNFWESKLGHNIEYDEGVKGWERKQKQKHLSSLYWVGSVTWYFL